MIAVTTPVLIPTILVIVRPSNGHSWMAKARFSNPSAIPGSSPPGPHPFDAATACPSRYNVVDLRRGAGNPAIRAVLKTAGPRGPCGFESHPLRHAGTTATQIPRSNQIHGGLPRPGRL